MTYYADVYAVNEGDLELRMVDATVKVGNLRSRRKLGIPDGWRYIHTIHFDGENVNILENES